MPTIFHVLLWIGHTRTHTHWMGTTIQVYDGGSGNVGEEGDEKMTIRIILISIVVNIVLLIFFVVAMKKWATAINGWQEAIDGWKETLEDWECYVKERKQK